jgi:hypothetical protein
MITELNNLLKDISSADQKVQDEAVLNLALLLEKHSSRPDSQSNYELVLPAYLHLVILSEDDQKKIIDVLSGLLRSEKLSPRMLWALGKTTLREALPPLLKFIYYHADEVDDATVWQALASIENFLVFREDGRLDNQVLSALIANNPIQPLARIAKRGNSDLKSITQRIMSKLGREPSLAPYLPK